MRLVILESPYAGTEPTSLESSNAYARRLECIAYARRAVYHSLTLGEAPIASHLLYTQPGILNDEFSADREHGIAAGQAWIKVAAAVVVYADLGVSPGMQSALEVAKSLGVPVEIRLIGSE